MLGLAPILIVEDEPFIALELKASVEEAGGRVVGPVGTAADALALLETERVAAAILDVELRDRDVTPVAEALIERGVPVVFQSGVGLPPALRRRLPEAVVYTKPVAGRVIVEKIVEMIRG